MKYKHSGAMGDIIYALTVIKKMGAGEFHIIENNLKTLCAGLGYNVSVMHKQHEGCMTKESIEFLCPLLEAQDYITKVTSGKDKKVNVNLDDFRNVLWRSFHGNYVEGYFKTFDLPFEQSDLQEPWIDVPSHPKAPYIVARTPRYITDGPAATLRLKSIAYKYDFTKNAMFIGTEEEHKQFQIDSGKAIHHYKVKDAFELAQMIKGCSKVFSNQTMVYSLAMALGKPAMLEYQKNKPLNQNECYFRRDNVEYI